MAQQLGSFEKVLRFGEGRRVKRLAEQAAYIGTLEPEFKQRIENGEPVDELVFEAFAGVREAFKRSMGIRLFDVQQMGGIVLHEGDIAEMKTGEGKTFVAVQPLYLNALTGNSVHLVTVNDYLAKRDPEWTKPVWDILGMRASSSTAPTPNSASTTCATTWPSRSTASSSAATTSRSWTRSTRS